MAPHILAVLIFVVMFVLIVMDKIERQYVSLGCGLLMIVLVFGLGMHSKDAIVETLNVKSIFQASFWYTAAEGEASSSGINWSTIIFILGMMIMVEGMGKAGFFRWLCLEIAKLVKYRTIPVFITFMLMSFVLAMFIDSITVILATMCGDPPNIIIGTSLGYTFGEFISNTGFIALISLIVIVIYFYLCFHKELAGQGAAVQITSYPDPKEAITDKGEFAKSCVIFLLAVVLLVTHAQTGLTVAFIGTFIAILTLVTQYKDAKELLSKVDYKTLLFFIGLFVVVGGLEQTGVLEEIAGLISKLSGSNGMLMCAIILWISAIASAFVDNIPFAATMIPVIQTLSALQGIDLTTLACTLSMGTDIGGSATPIGASANVVGISVATKQGYPIGWGYYCKYAAPATIIVISISMVCIFLRYF